MSAPYIVAELSANHLGRLERALELVGAAAWAGADAVKLQTFTPENMAMPGHVIKGGPWDGRDLQDLYRETMTPRAWHEPIFAKAKALGIEAFSSAFSVDDIAFLESIGCPRYKIASFELNDHDLIRAAASTGRPVILSTGMATMNEIGEAAGAARDMHPGCDLTILACQSAYPAPLRPYLLEKMHDIGRRFECAIGLSDHTDGIGMSVMAAYAGADMIERHLTLNREDGGPDAAFSLEPEELRMLVATATEVSVDEWQEIEGGRYRDGPELEELPQLALRRSLWVVRGIKKGETLTTQNVRALRPGGGLSPAAWPYLEDRPANTAYKAGEPFHWIEHEPLLATIRRALAKP